jgi:hypothetical protein
MLNEYFDSSNVLYGLKDLKLYKNRTMAEANVQLTYDVFLFQSICYYNGNSSFSLDNYFSVQLGARTGHKQPRISLAVPKYKYYKSVKFALRLFNDYRSFIICTRHKILLGWSNPGGLCG